MTADKIDKGILERIINSAPFFGGAENEFVQFGLDCLQDVRLSSLRFSCRFANALKYLNKTNLMELLLIDKSVLYKLPNCGKKSISHAEIIILDYLETNLRYNEGETESSREEKFTTKTSSENEVQGEHVCFVPFLDICVKPSILNHCKTVTIDVLNLPIRLRKRLRGIQTVFELLDKDSKKIKKIRHIGQRTLDDAKKSIICYLAEIENTLSSLTFNKSVANSLELRSENDIFNLIDSNYLDLNLKQKRIFLDLFGDKMPHTLAVVGLRNGLTRERVRQIKKTIMSRICFRMQSVISNFERQCLEILLTKPEPIELDVFDISGKTLTQDTYVNVISEVIPHLPLRPQTAVKIFPFNDRRVATLPLPFGRINITNLIMELGISEVREKLKLITQLIYSSNYRFCTDNGIDYFIVRKNTIPAMIKEILMAATQPLEIEAICNTLQKYYRAKIENPESVIEQLKKEPGLFQFGRKLFGMEKHFSYPKTEWDEILGKIIKVFSDEGRELNAVEIFNQIKPKYNYLRSKYELVHILRSNNHILDLGFFNFCLKEYGVLARTQVKDAIMGIFDKCDQPLHFHDIFSLVKQVRFARIEGMTSILGGMVQLQNYGGGYYGLKCRDRENIIHLLINPLFIEKVLVNKLFPNTSPRAILKHLGREEGVEILQNTVNSAECLLLCHNYTNQGEFIISSNWSNSRIIICYIYSNDDGCNWEEIEWWFNDLDRQLSNQDKYKLLNNPSIAFVNDKYHYRGTTIKETDTTVQNIISLCVKLCSDSEEIQTIDKLYEQIIPIESCEKSDLVEMLSLNEQFLVIDESLVMVVK